MDNVAIQPTKTFEIKTRRRGMPDDTLEVTGRAAAVTKAKRLSRDEGVPVRVKRLDGTVEMEFAGGSMTRYGVKAGRRS